MKTVSDLSSWLDRLVREGGSDLYLVCGAAPSIRVDRHLRALGDDTLTSEYIEQLATDGLSESAIGRYRSEGHADVSLRVAGRRFRINVHRERGRPALTGRALPASPPRLRELNLPQGVAALARLSHGLVLVGGPAGSGKTTTVAALVNEINHAEAKHIVTIEDPIEFEHPHLRSVVEQIEVGSDAKDFASALRSAVRQSPDVIVIGEMRDPETMTIALAAAETGHLVLSTLHTTDITATVSRIAGSFPADRQATVHQELAMALSAVVVQLLVPRVSGGLVPAVEMLMVGYGARHHIRKNALQHLHQEMTITRRDGSVTFEESLASLVNSGLIGVEDARSRVRHRDEFEAMLRMK